MDNKIGLYLHIPFCMSKCAYCDFYSNAGESDYERFVNAMALHMEDYAPSLRGREIDSLYRRRNAHRPAYRAADDAA